MEISVTNLEETPIGDAAGGGKVEGTLHYKYIPRTEDWGSLTAAIEKFLSIPLALAKLSGTGRDGKISPHSTTLSIHSQT